MQFYNKYLCKVLFLCTVYVSLFLMSLTKIPPEIEMQFLTRLTLYKDTWIQNEGFGLGFCLFVCFLGGGWLI